MSSRELLDPDSLSDTEVISRVQKGDKDLYRIIVRRFNQRLYRVGMSILNNDSQVEDAMQVAYINAYENLGKFELRSSFGTWLTKILINECLLRIRRNSRLVSVDDSILEISMNQRHLVETKNPESKVLNSELKNALENAIARLPEKYRTVFIMREIEKMNVAETKECLDISEVNVKVRLNRAKAMLRETLSGYYQNDNILHFHLSRCDKMIENVLNRIHQLYG